MYTINGALGSPYSMKMRALMRYRRIPHLWVHGADSRDALSKVKAPVIPVMEYPDGTFHLMAGNSMGLLLLTLFGGMELGFPLGKLL